MSDPAAVRRKMITLVLVAVAVCVGFLLTSSPFLVAAMFGLVAYIGTLGQNYRWLALCIVAFQPASLIVPFFPGRPFLWELCALLSWPSLLVLFLIDRRRKELFRVDGMELAALVTLVGYVVVLVTLMLFRGVGFRVLGGGGQMGGRFYVQQVILTIVPLALLVSAHSRKTLLIALFTGWALATTYLISDFALTLGGPGLYTVLRFFELPTDAVNFYVGYEFSGLRRYQSFWFVGAAMLAALWTAMPLRDVVGRRFFVGMPVLLLGLGLGLASGHRTVFIQTATTLVLLSLIQRFWTPLRTLFTLMAASTALAGLYMFAEQLPPAIQRSISFLPGIQVSLQAQEDAYATLRDRIEVLKMGLNDLPEYWLLGRGFGMPRFNMFSPDAIHDSLTQQYINGLFYNGFIGSLLKTGVPGVVCTLAFIFIVSRMALQVIRRVREKPVYSWTVFDCFCAFIGAHWFALVSFFYFLHGDAAVWTQVFALPAALIMVCRRTLLAEDTPAPEESQVGDLAYNGGATALSGPLGPQKSRR